MRYSAIGVSFFCLIAGEWSTVYGGFFHQTGNANTYFTYFGGGANHTNAVTIQGGAMDFDPKRSDIHSVTPTVLGTGAVTVTYDGQEAAYAGQGARLNIRATSGTLKGLYLLTGDETVPTENFAIESDFSAVVGGIGGYDFTVPNEAVTIVAVFDDYVPTEVYFSTCIIKGTEVTEEIDYVIPPLTSFTEDIVLPGDIVPGFITHNGERYDFAGFIMFAEDGASYSLVESSTILAEPAYGTAEWNEWKASVPEGLNAAYMRHTHNYVPESDDSRHWTECDCGEKTAVQAHSYTGKYNATYHWEECSCGDKSDEIKHSYDSDTDTACDCGYTRTIEHTHSYTPTYDSTHHWDECSCGDEQNKAEHSYDSDTDATCDCGYERMIAISTVVGVDIKTPTVVKVDDTPISATVKVEFRTEEKIPAKDAEKIIEYASTLPAARAYDIAWMDISVTRDDNGEALRELREPIAVSVDMSVKTTNILGVVGVHNSEPRTFTYYNYRNLWAYDDGLAGENFAPANLPLSRTMVNMLLSRFSTYAIIYEVEQTTPDTELDNDYWLWMLMMLHNQEFDITAATTNGGAITPDGVSKVKYSKDLTYTVTPDDGYAIADVIVDGKSVGAVSAYTFDNVRKDHEITAIFAEIPWENPYSDVSESDWFYEDVKFVDENNLMKGTVENEIFAPELTATRAMIVTILWRLEGEPLLDYLMQFEDVPQDEWYSEAVRWAAANGIVLGYDGLFNPENPITREQLAAILHRYAAYKGMDSGAIFPMIPQYDYSEWAENDVIWADMNGLLDGIGSDMTDLTADASRAEVAAMLRRFCERFIVTK